MFEPTAIQKYIDLKSYLLMANTLFDRAKVCADYDALSSRLLPINNKEAD